MKKLIGCLLAALAVSASAQMTVVPNLVVSGSSIYASGPLQSTAATQGFLDSSTNIASTQFVKQTILAAQATIPFQVTGGTYNFASVGTGAVFATLTSGGAITLIPAVANGGSGYQVGDCLIMVGGNGDAVARVTSVSSGVITAAAVLYGGTGYSGSPQASGMNLPPGQRDGELSGVLTSNATIIVPSGVYLQGSRRFIFNNNTTGAFTVTIKLSNGSGGSTGNGVVLPQGSNNSTSMEIYTDGVNDVWAAINAFPLGVTCSGSPTASFATSNGVVTHC